MRQLATIQKIAKLDAIPNADKIEVATILGWKAVVGKGEFKVGDLVIYCEIDSILPDAPMFEHMRKHKFRVKTIRLRGQISQGLVLNLNSIAQHLAEGVYKVEEGQDVTDLLQITKYEPVIPAQLAGKVKGNFPSFIPKTDETRVQVLQPLLDKYKGKMCYITEKLDGSSVTFYWYNGEFGVCSRNLELKEESGNSMWKWARENKLQEMMESVDRETIGGFQFAIQGEIVGPGINGNNLKLPETTVYFFNAYDIKRGEYICGDGLSELCAMLEVEMVPVVEEHYTLDNDIDKLVSMATIKSKLNPNAWAEGIVIRPGEEIVDNDIMNLHHNRVSFKVINPEYLLKTEQEVPDAKS